MNTIQDLKYHPGSKEELLPGFTQTFPYIASRAELDHFAEQFVPWHWHRAVEIFYLESGSLEYSTPAGSVVFSAGSGGFVNSNVLHTTRILTHSEPNVQFLHIFDPVFLAGEVGSRIDTRYISPLTTASQVELLAFSPSDPAQKAILDRILEAFQLSPSLPGYELRLRNQLAELWWMILQQAEPLLHTQPPHRKENGRIKSMLAYLHEHYPEKITVAQLAASAHLSERECYRIFQDAVHLSPIEYLTQYRLQLACRMLASGTDSVTAISQLCGFGSSSYFGKLFAQQFHCTPLEYRRKWQDHHK